MEFLFIVIILIMSVVIHEVSHGYAALYLGDPTAKFQGRLTLNPISHLDPIGSVLVPVLGYLSGGFIIGWAKPVPFNPYNLRPEKLGLSARAGEPIVAAAGPISNILLALIFGLFIRFASGYGLLNQTFFDLAGFIVILNITLAIFNLIPIPPLDGSKILFAFFPYRFQAWRQSLERFGLVLILVFVFLMWQLFTPFISLLFHLITGLAV